MHHWIARPLRAGLVALILALAALTAPGVAGRADAASSAWFRSPSGNIGCYMTTTGVRCDVIEYAYTPSSKPAGCDFAWGPAFRVGLTGKGRFACVSDTVAGSTRVLRYGKSITIGAFRCTSRATGMTCTDTKNGHGFTVSRLAYRFF
jgi:hypothetical protein